MFWYNSIFIIWSNTDFNDTGNDFETRDSLCKKQCVNIIFEFLVFAKVTNPLIEPIIDEALPIQILTHSSHDNYSKYDVIELKISCCTYGKFSQHRNWFIISLIKRILVYKLYH